MNEKAVLIECEMLPVCYDEQETLRLAEDISKKYCYHCGYMKDSSGRGLKIYCFSPADAYLAALKEQLKKQGVTSIKA